jgi:hypothetical protein
LRKAFFMISEISTMVRVFVGRMINIDSIFTTGLGWKGKLKFSRGITKRCVTFLQCFSF